MIFVLSVSVIILSLLVIGLLYSPGELEPLRDEQGNVLPDSISEKVWVEINGIKQGMFIRGENRQNPIILYLHGGPGTPLLQFISYLESNKRLEKHFTICYWDQRGSGMTYNTSTDSATLNVDQMVEDVHEVTKYLKSHFDQKQIYLIGHSWGSYLGVKTIERYPSNYLAYIGIGQVTNQTESERLAHDFMLKRASERNDESIIKKLKKYDPNADIFPQLTYLAKVRTMILNKYGVGHLHQGLTFLDILKSILVFKGYTLSEKIHWFRGADLSMVHLFPPLLKDDLFTSSTEFKVPFYIIQGSHDYMVSQVLAEKYLEVLHAPKKEFFMFESSAHSPNMEEPERFIKTFCEIASRVSCIDKKHFKGAVTSEICDVTESF